MDKIYIDLSKHRMEQAYQCIKSAELLRDASDYKGAANRSYYAIFHAIRSILALEQKDFSKHSAVGSYFRKEYIKTGIFPVEMSDIITDAFEIRNESDYDDYFLISKEDVTLQIQSATFFCKAIENYLSDQYGTNEREK